MSRTSHYEVRGLSVSRHEGTDPEAVQVVLVHGAMDRGAGMLRVARRLRDHTVVRFDRRGYARSHHLGPASSFREQVDDLRAVLDGRPSIVLGHSYGGVVAMALATTAASEVIAVVTYEAPRAWESWWPEPPSAEEDPAEAAELFLRRMIGDELWSSLPERTRRQRRAEGLTMVTELRQQRTQRYDARLIRVPVVVGVGSTSGERAQRAAPITASEAPLGQLCRIEGAGHGAHMSHPTDLAAMVRAALPV